MSPSAVRRERALWCLNLDAEDELRHGLGYTPRQATLAAVAAARGPLAWPRRAAISTTPAIPGPQKMSTMLASRILSDSSHRSTAAETAKTRPQIGGEKAGTVM